MFLTKQLQVMNDEDLKEDDEPKQTSDIKIRQKQPRYQISSKAKSTECPECGKVFTRKDSMMTHYRSKHEGIKYSCILVISVILYLHNKVIFRHILSLNMKVSGILVICVII